jgi:hypothetical protein
MVRAAIAVALGLGGVGIATVATSAEAGATGSTPTAFTFTVNGANATSTTASPVSTVALAGLPVGATGTIEFDSGATVLCTANLPATSCSTVSLSNGTYPGIAGTYSGDATYAGSTSTNTVDLTVGSGGGPSLSCGKMSGFQSKKAAIAKCGVAQAGAHFPGADLLTGGTVTWARSKTTTTFTGAANSPGQGSCATGRVEYDFSGTVTADTSTFVTVGDAVGYNVCVNSTTGVIKLVEGTRASL